MVVNFIFTPHGVHVLMTATSVTPALGQSSGGIRRVLPTEHERPSPMLHKLTPLFTGMNRATAAAPVGSHTRDDRAVGDLLDGLWQETLNVAVKSTAVASHLNGLERTGSALDHAAICRSPKRSSPRSWRHHCRYEQWCF